MTHPSRVSIGPPPVPGFKMASVCKYEYPLKGRNELIMHDVTE